MLDKSTGHGDNIASNLVLINDHQIGVMLKNADDTDDADDDN